MALFNIKLDIDETYKQIIDQYLYILSSFLFLMILEPLNGLTSITLFLYNILGMLFHNLVLKHILKIN